VFLHMECSLDEGKELYFYLSIHPPTHPSIHPFNKYILSTYHVPSSVLGARVQLSTKHINFLPSSDLNSAGEDAQ
jgi:hypothetical protein